MKMKMKMNVDAKKHFGVFTLDNNIVKAGADMVLNVVAWVKVVSWEYGASLVFHNSLTDYSQLIETC